MRHIRMGQSLLLDRGSFLIFGAARSGLAAARLLRQLGKKVAIYDEAAREKLESAMQSAKEMDVPLLTKADGVSIPGAWEVMVLSPGIPSSHPLVKQAAAGGCLVRSEIEIGFLKCPAPIVAITGTNGKTTTTHLVAHLIEQSGCPSIMGGNVGRALCDAVQDDKVRQAGAVVVCEVSSYQCETIEQFHPRVSAILNVTPDHLDRYASMQDYADAKLRIAMNQTQGEALVLNQSCPYCQGFCGRTNAGLWWFSSSGPVSRGAYLQSGSIHFIAGEGVAPVEIMAARDIPIPGLHNVENVMASIIMCAAMGIDPASLAPHVKTFRAVPHRNELVAEVEGVRYYNDSKATNLDSLEKALESFGDPVILIAGGRDKGAPWTPLNDLVARKVKALVLIGEAAPIGRAAWGRLVQAVVDAVDMEDAVRKASDLAARGDVVLLSPACASFDMYRDFEERGDHFRSIVQAMLLKAGG